MENQEIIARFLKESPQGEFDDCYSAIGMFVEDQDLLQEGKSLAFKEWALNHFVQVDVEDHKAILCKYANISEDKFVDPETSKVFNYDFATKTVTMEEEEVSETTELRDKLQDSVSRMTAKSFKNGVAGVYVDGDALRIIVSASFINRQNYRTASIVFDFKFEDEKLKGTIEFNSHSYESGNAVGHQRAEFSKDISEEPEKNIPKALNAFYSEWNTKVTDGIQSISEEGLNKFRRRLPITASKINWRSEMVGTASMQLK